MLQQGPMGQQPMGMSPEAQLVLFLGQEAGQRLGRTKPDFIGPDGLGRYEIDDSAAALLRMPQEGSPERAGDVFNHPELYKADPSAADTMIHYDSSKNKGSAEYWPSDQSIHLGPIDRSKPGQATSDTLHEFQHKVGDDAGFDSGSSSATELESINRSGEFVGESDKFKNYEAFRSYRSDLGEQEARDVEERWRKRLSGALLDPAAMDFDPQGEGIDYGRSKAEEFGPMRRWAAKRREAGEDVPRGSYEYTNATERRDQGLPTDSQRVTIGRNNPKWDDMVEEADLLDYRVLKSGRHYYMVPKGFKTSDTSQWEQFTGGSKPDNLRGIAYPENPWNRF